MSSLRPTLCVVCSSPTPTQPFYIPTGAHSMKGFNWFRGHTTYATSTDARGLAKSNLNEEPHKKPLYARSSPMAAEEISVKKVSEQHLHQPRRLGSLLFALPRHASKPCTKSRSPKTRSLQKNTTWLCLQSLHKTQEVTMWFGCPTT